MHKRFPIIGLVVALVELFSTSHAAYAHETWFVKTGNHAGEHFSMDVTNLLVILGASLFTLFVFAIHRTSWLRNIDALFEKVDRWLSSGIQWRIVAILTGSMFIANSISGVFLAPDFVLPGDGPVVLGRVIQLIIGLLLVSQISLSLAGVLIVMVAIPLAGIYAPGSFLIDCSVEYLALGLAFLFAGHSSRYLDKLVGRWIQVDLDDYRHLPLQIIRVGLGLMLIILSIHHKLTNPDIALTFLDNYELNFMPQLGITGFTNLHLVFAAGVAEAILGLLLVAGVATRLVSAGLAMFFLATLFLLGPVELVGHLPLIGIALLLLCQGSGSYRLAPPDVEMTLELSTAVSI